MNLSLLFLYAIASGLALKSLSTLVKNYQVTQTEPVNSLSGDSVLHGRYEHQAD